MAATSTSDLLFRVKPRWTTTIGSSGVADATTTTIPLASASGLNDGEAYIVTINRVDANGDKQSTWETVKGVLSGTNLINCVRGVEGTASAWSAGTVVEILMTAEHWNKMVEAWETEHNQDGTHGAVTATSVTSSGDITTSGAVKTDTVSEKTTDSGVSVDGVSLKDGGVTATGDISGANITANTAVKADTISEKTSGAGVTVDGVLLKDNGVTASGDVSGANLTANTAVKADTISEKTADAGVTVDGLNIKDGTLNTANAVTALSAISGGILQVSKAENTTQVSLPGYDGSNHPTFIMELSFTPKRSDSEIYVLGIASNVSNGGSGRVEIKLVYDSVSGGTSGTAISSVQSAQDSSGTSGLSVAPVVGSFSASSTSTIYIKMIGTKADDGNTGYVNQYGGVSSIVALEVRA